jgi:fatty-acyl-CoA synthase
MAGPGFADVIHAQAARDARAQALLNESGPVSYGALARRIDAAAALLAGEWGVRPGDRVAWLGANDAAQLVLLFAAARVGAMLLPLNFRLAPAEWDAQLAQCTPRLIVHDPAWGDAATELARRNRVAAHAAHELDAGGACDVPNAASADAPVLLVFTSGTTGAPRAAAHTQANLLAGMRIGSAAQAMTPADRILTCLPLFHVGGLCIQTLPALFAGASVILQPRFAPDLVFDALERDRPTLSLQVPATMKALIEHPRWHAADLSSLRAVWAGSSLIPAALIDAFHGRGVPVCNVYGSTESGPFSIALGPADAMRKAGSCGWPAAGIEARLAEVQQGTGEVWLRGPNVVGRYWPAEPACDEHGWLHTGDLARQDADGSFTIVGRARDLIISGGENIHPAEIEAALATHEGVLECAAFGLPDAQWGEIAAVAVVARPGSALDEVQLRAHLEQRVARYKLPRRWVFVEGLPKTALGKVQRGELARMLKTSPG